MISVVILTKNEERDLAGCLDSLSWCDDVHVVDSGSTDRTIDIAREYNATVTVNPFEGFGTQRNFALEHLNLKHPWVLFLDADEHATAKFYASISQQVRYAGEDVAGFYCCCKLMLEGRWLKRSDTFPRWQFRLLKKGRARYVNMGHGQKEASVTGSIGYIREPYLHFGTSKGWHYWIERHNRYSSLEAELRFYHCPPFANIFVRHASVRNVALKSWLSKFKAWPYLRFIHAYILNGGFLEGRQGLCYCINNFFYEYMISLKYGELKYRSKTAERQPAGGNFTVVPGNGASGGLQPAHNEPS